MAQSIKHWHKEERPREKMELRGCDALSTAELLAILLNSGRSDKNAIDIAREVMDLAQNSLVNLSRMPIGSLTSIKGIGKAKASTIIAAAEFGRRLASEDPAAIPAIHNSSDIVRMLGPYMKGLRHEELWAVFLNKANKVIGKEMISSGGTDETLVDVKMLVSKAVSCLCSGVVMVHNHPSGNASPSQQDIRWTKSTRDALACLEIKLLDHVIIAGNKFYSFSDER